jgi:hypothetical protein
MIATGSMIILATKEAIYSPCKVLDLNANSVRIQYFAGTKKDRVTGEFKQVHLTETILIKNVTQMSERL